MTTEKKVGNEPPTPRDQIITALKAMSESPREDALTPALALLTTYYPLIVEDYALQIAQDIFNRQTNLINSTELDASRTTRLHPHAFSDEVKRANTEELKLLLEKRAKIVEAHKLYKKAQKRVEDINNLLLDPTEAKIQQREALLAYWQSAFFAATLPNILPDDGSHEFISYTLKALEDAEEKPEIDVVIHTSEKEQTLPTRRANSLRLEEEATHPVMSTQDQGAKQTQNEESVITPALPERDPYTLWKEKTREELFTSLKKWGVRDVVNEVFPDNPDAPRKFTAKYIPKTLAEAENNFNESRITTEIGTDQKQQHPYAVRVGITFISYDSHDHCYFFINQSEKPEKEKMNKRTELHKQAIYLEVEGKSYVIEFDIPPKSPTERPTARSKEDVQQELRDQLQKLKNGTFHHMP